jgi:hypothetical protein
MSEGQNMFNALNGKFSTLLGTFDASYVLRVLLKKWLAWVAVLAIVFMPYIVEAGPQLAVDGVFEFGDGNQVFFECRAQDFVGVSGVGSQGGKFVMKCESKPSARFDSSLSVGGTNRTDDSSDNTNYSAKNSADDGGKDFIGHWGVFIGLLVGGIIGLAPGFVWMIMESPNPGRLEWLQVFAWGIRERLFPLPWTLKPNFVLDGAHAV